MDVDVKYTYLMTASVTENNDCNGSIYVFKGGIRQRNLKFETIKCHKKPFKFEAERKRKS
jgi:hypothetical protein